MTRHGAIAPSITGTSKHTVGIARDQRRPGRGGRRTEQSDDPVSGPGYQQVSIVVEGRAVNRYRFRLQRELELGNGQEKKGINRFKSTLFRQRL